mmetsp:Transcript_15636/g.31586  ORF Transcript_15636/g.31586 Transcript_15636/m.31586 type:complete len:223 (+) Transcript_15636:36-704(+)
MCTLHSWLTAERMHLTTSSFCSIFRHKLPSCSVFSNSFRASCASPIGSSVSWYSCQILRRKPSISLVRGTPISTPRTPFSMSDIDSVTWPLQNCSISWIAAEICATLSLLGTRCSSTSSANVSLPKAFTLSAISVDSGKVELMFEWPVLDWCSAACVACSLLATSVAAWLASACSASRYSLRSSSDCKTWSRSSKTSDSRTFAFLLQKRFSDSMFFLTFATA